VADRRQLWLRWIVPVTLIGLVLRWWVLGTTSGYLNADEAYSGLQAMDIVEGDRPVVIRGIGYTAVVDSYVFAPFVWLFGAHVVPLKMLTSLWWALAALVAGRLARDLVSGSDPARAVLAGRLTASATWITPGALMIVSTRAWQAYGLLMLAVSLTGLFAARVLAEAPTRRRWSAAVGASAGLAFFLHPMTLSIVMPLLLVCSVLLRKQIRDWWIPVVLSGFAVNIPFLAWNVKNGWLSLAEPSPPMDSYVERLARFFTGLLPRAFGVMDTGGAWSFGGLGAVMILGFGSIVVIGLVGMARMGREGWVVVVAVVAVWPALATFNSVWFVDDGRYAIVAFPMVTVAAVIGALRVLAWPKWSRTGRVIAQGVVGVCVGLWVVVLSAGWILVNAGPRVGDPNGSSRDVVELLDEAGVRFAAGNYWHVTPVEYLSNGRIHVAVAGHPWGAILDWRPRLPWGVFFPGRQTEVAGRLPEEVAFVFAADDVQEGVLRMPVAQYARHDIGPAVVFVPAVSPLSASSETAEKPSD
jgi:hypothetical protein